MAKNIALLAINRLSEPPLIAYLPVVKLSQRTQDISVEILYKVRKIKIIINLDQYVIVLIRKLKSLTPINWRNTCFNTLRLR